MTKPDFHAKAGKILRATDEQWTAWQREANRRTDGNLTAYLHLAADTLAKIKTTVKVKRAR